MTATAPRWMTPRLGIILALLLTAAAYWPGLYGSYLFDDYPNIVDNKSLQIEHFNLANLARAALASPSSELKRPLASLSFAGNFLLTGLDPFWMKFTNLVVHLLNGILIYCLSISLIQTARSDHSPDDVQDVRWPALLIATAWLLLPINLTCVLYVVQRMESLANLFVLMSLLGYVRARQHMQRHGSGFTSAAAALASGTAIGLLAKETAVMVPLYALLIEWVLFHSRSANQRRDNRIIGLFLVVLFIPLALGLAWLLPGTLNSSAWATRSFSLQERLLTETRVVVDYILWILLPTPQSLSFYHDDYPVSTGWLTPWTTLLCTSIIATLLALVIFLRNRTPLAALGIALFSSAQLLTATIVPLELVYEHRNYFASFALLLALIPLLSAGTHLASVRGARYMLLVGLLLLWGVSTASTAMAWSSPLTLSQTLAQRAPNSPRAQYGLGYTYIVLSKYDPQSPFAVAAYAPLERAMKLPNASILPEQALIMMNAHMHLPIEDAWWDSMVSKLKLHEPDIQSITALGKLANGTVNHSLDLPTGRMVEAFIAALSHPNPDARLLASYGDYAWNILNDQDLGLDMTQEAIRVSGGEAAYRVTAIRMLIVLNRITEARRQYQLLASRNIGGTLDDDLASLRKSIDTHTSAVTAQSHL